MLSSLQPLIRRFTITRHMALSLVQNVRCVLDNPRKHPRVDGDGTPDSTRKIKRSTLVISSTDLIPRSWNPFDCESATGECSNSVPRDPRRIRDLLQRIHDCWFLIELQGHLTMVSQSFQIASTLLNHPINGRTFQWHHVS